MSHNEFNRRTGERERVGGDELVRATGFWRKVDGTTLLAINKFRIAAGDRIAIVGPTGSGKSLLLRAIGLRPDVLLLDEPTAAIDSAASGHVESLVDRWVSESGGSRAYVWVTHDAAQADRVGTQRVQIRAGKIDTATPIACNRGLTWETDKA